MLRIPLPTTSRRGRLVVQAGHGDLSTQLDDASRRWGGSSRLYVASGLLAVATLLAFQVDLAVLDFMRNGGLRGDLRRVVEFSEVFAHGFGIGLILLTIVVLDPTRLWAVPRMLACSFGSGIAVDVVKLLIGRTRPRDHEFATVWDSFQGWVPMLGSGGTGDALNSSIQSFPSGHAATAVGLAVALSYLYPRGRWLFGLYAVLAAVQRLHVGAHFFSDTLAGAAIGCLIAGLCCDSARCGKWFDRLEASRGRDSTN